jgi:hypothetical protein
MAGGETNPLGARAMYLGSTEYRIHGTKQPSTIGTFVSSGCIRLTNEDVEDLYSRVTVGTRVIVLPGANTAALNDCSAHRFIGCSIKSKHSERRCLKPKSKSRLAEFIADDARCIRFPRYNHKMQQHCG